MSDQIKMPLSVSLLLSEMINTLLQKTVKNEDGTVTVLKRNLPFRLEYRLTRNKTSLEKDLQRYEQARYLALAKYGESSADGSKVIIVDETKAALFTKEMEAVLDTEITHSVVKIDPKDFDSITDSINFSTDAIKVLSLYLVEDADLIKDIEMKVNFKPYEPTEEEKKLLEEKKTDVDKLTAEEWALVQKFREEKAQEEKLKNEEVKPVEKATSKTKEPSEKKTVTKKTAVKKKPAAEEAPIKETTTAKTTSAKKTTTTKKTTTKKKETK